MGVNWIERADLLTPNVRNFINGHSVVPSGSKLEKHSPRDGRLLTTFFSSQKHEVEDAVRSAREAIADGRWSRMPLHRRKEVLNRLAALIEQHAEELALLESLDVGKPIQDSLGFDVPAAASILRFNAEAADKYYGEVYVANLSCLSYELHRPLGVFAGIVGWNFPLVLAAGKIGPALAMGNSLVLKPSELTPLSASRVAELAIEAGVPEGVLNVVHGGSEVGSILARHGEIDGLTFTGSTSTGKKIVVAAGESNLKRLTLECGGKAPNIVFDDVSDLQAVAESVAARAFWNQGQVCTASSRLLVHETIKDRLLPMLIDKVSQLRPGDPLSPRAKLGAVVSKTHQEKVHRYVEIGVSEGAKVAYRCEATPPLEEGFYASPVIFDEVRSDFRIAQEEIFGPVLSVISFRDEHEAIRIANNTIYGLSAIVWTKDVGRAHRVAQSIESGWVVLNATGSPTGAPPWGSIPIGGHKESGWGAEGGVAGLQEYVRKTTVQMFV